MTEQGRQESRRGRRKSCNNGNDSLLRRTIPADSGRLRTAESATLVRRSADGTAPLAAKFSHRRSTTLGTGSPSRRGSRDATRAHQTGSRGRTVSDDFLSQDRRAVQVFRSVFPWSPASRARGPVVFVVTLHRAWRITTDFRRAADTALLFSPSSSHSRSRGAAPPGVATADRRPSNAERWLTPPSCGRPAGGWRFPTACASIWGVRSVTDTRPVLSKKLVFSFRFNQQRH